MHSVNTNNHLVSNSTCIPGGHDNVLAHFLIKSFKFTSISDNNQYNMVCQELAWYNIYDTVFLSWGMCDGHITCYSQISIRKDPCPRKKNFNVANRVKGYNRLSDTSYQGPSIGSKRWSYKKEGLEAFSMAIKKPLGFKRIWRASLVTQWLRIHLPSSLVGLMVDPGRAHAKEYFPEFLLSVSLSTWWATAAPCLCRCSNTSHPVSRYIQVNGLTQPDLLPHPPGGLCYWSALRSEGGGLTISLGVCSGNRDNHPATGTCGWQGLGAPAGCQAWASEVGEPSSGHWTTRDLPAPCNINRQELSKRLPSQREDPAPLNDQQAPVLDTPCQTTSKTGTKHHPLAERLPKIIISSDTPKHTKGRGLAHQKDKIQPHPLEHRHYSPPPGNLHNSLNQSYPLGADTKNNENYEHAACEKETPNTVS